MCGTMIPTKAISPLTETAAAVPSVAATTIASRARATSTPRLAASSSPRLRTSSTRRWRTSTSELDRDVRRADRDVGPRRGREAAEQPRVDVLQHVGVPLLDEGLHGGGERRDRDAGEDEGAARVHRAGRAAEDVRGDDRDDRAAEGGERHRPVGSRRGRRRVHDRERRAETGAAGDAEQVRIRERVPEDALIRGAGDREHPADERRERRPAARAICQSDRAVDHAERLMDVEERDVRERRAEDRAEPGCAPARPRGRRERDDEERRGDEAGAEADAAGLDPRRLLRPSGAVAISGH